MMHDAPERASFPVSPENTPTKRRAVFSASFAGLTSHHVQPDIVTSTSRRRRNLDDDSLRLIDDLTNRPMDVMYTDSRLATKTPSLFSVWFRDQFDTDFDSSSTRARSAFTSLVRVSTFFV